MTREAAAMLRDTPMPDLSRARLPRIAASGKTLAHWTLEHADLRYADLRGADLRGANLRRANLMGADLSGADLSGADASFADLTEVNWTGAILKGTILRGADLRIVSEKRKLDDVRDGLAYVSNATESSGILQEQQVLSATYDHETILPEHLKHLTKTHVL
ncbi:pentapeptide repeat-containing protein [Roseospira navarrensis]|uniref:Pentapeptide repeat-containing protein n=1 Tax=Roseospira navarrensis TaxID=140058 RepID=A0A7X2D4S1_9PROT|nr:pentapeptide repeat-containing protein [Roseospira navarrensis]MQX38151.1 hypothetical protein [Roseospira navarrensis]